VAEQFRLDQCLGQSRATHGDEGLLDARALFVDGAREHLFARAVFARQEHGYVRRSDGARLFHNAFERGRTAEEATEAAKRAERGAQVEILFFEMAHARRLPDDVRDFVFVERLLKKAVRAAADGFERGLPRVAAGDDDDGYAGACGARRFDDGETFADAVQIGRQVEIAQDDLHAPALQLCDGGGARVGFEHVMLRVERPEKLTPQNLIVVNDEHRRFVLCRLGLVFAHAATVSLVSGEFQDFGLKSAHARWPRAGRTSFQHP
jgi:hypothetical protein